MIHSLTNSCVDLFLFFFYSPVLKLMIKELSRKHFRIGCTQKAMNPLREQPVGHPVRRNLRPDTLNISLPL